MNWAALARTTGALREPSAKAAAKRPVSWSEIERAILLRIARRDTRPASRSRLRSAAIELGANKNTVSKAYRSLAAAGLPAHACRLRHFREQAAASGQHRRRSGRDHRPCFARRTGSEALRALGRAISQLRQRRRDAGVRSGGAAHRFHRVQPAATRPCSAATCSWPLRIRSSRS